jgi:hypothetical protein
LDMRNIFAGSHTKHHWSWSFSCWLCVCVCVISKEAMMWWGTQYISILQSQFLFCFVLGGIGKKKKEITKHLDMRNIYCRSHILSTTGACSYTSCWLCVCIK